MTVTITTDRTLCIGSEMCVRAAPHTFTTDDEGLVVAAAAGPDSEDDLRTAVASCPVGALAVAP